MSDSAAGTPHSLRTPTPSAPQPNTLGLASSPVTPAGSLLPNALNTPLGSDASPHNPGSSPGALSGGSPLSLLGTPHSSQRARYTPDSLGRSATSRRSAGSRLGSEAASEAASTDGSSDGANAQRAHIWGTTVDALRCKRSLKRFVDEFRLAGAEPDSRPFYHSYLEQLQTLQDNFVNLDCTHLKSFSPSLYRQLVDYPQELVGLIDEVLLETVRELYPGTLDEFKVISRPFNLDEATRLRELDPNDIDKLVSVKGMVTRTSAIIPDLRTGCFECAVCGTAQLVEVRSSRIEEPQVCTLASCQAKNSMTLIHNRSFFFDKQVMRLQEAPEDMPEGETPQTVSMCLWEGLVDVAKPGDRVEVTGIFRATPVRTNARHRSLRAVYKTFVDIVHVRKLDKGRRLAPEAAEPTVASTTPGQAAAPPAFSEDAELDEASEARQEELLQLSRTPNLYERLAQALAPSIWELDDIKKGVLLQLFGGSHKVLDRESSSASSATKRGDINVLLVGDPGTSKSQILSYVHKVAPRGIYTSGKGSSAVGLTAYVTKDPETKQFVLESGALVLSDKGICCIDEFDKMSDGARSILHEAMEQQTVSVAKAGIICSLNARTSVLAAANPISSKYDPHLSVVENINLPPSLLSRFDLIYLVLDKVDERTDRLLADHLVSLYRLDVQPAAAEVSQLDLMEYISYAKAKCSPKIGDDAAQKLVHEYVTMRGMGSSKAVITATPRQLESLIRLSEAHARMRLSSLVEAEDVDEAVRLMKASSQRAAMDPTTGTLDMDLIYTGRSAAARNQAKQLAAGLKDRLSQMASGASVSLTELQASVQSDTQVDVPLTTMREAVAILERDGVVRFSRNVVTLAM